MILFLLIFLLFSGVAIAQDETDQSVIPDNTRFGARFIPERRNTDRTTSASGAGSIWFNSVTRAWKGDTGNGITAFGGTVTSIGLSLPPIFTITPGVITGSGTFVGELTQQVPNSVFIGPTNLPNDKPTFRLLQPQDIPSLDASKIVTGIFDVSRFPTLSLLPSGLLDSRCVRTSGGFLVVAAADCNVGGSGTVTSFSAGDLSPLFTTSEANPTTTPALSFALISQAQNLFFGSPNGSSGNPAFRALVLNDIPDLSSLYQPLNSKLTTLAGNTLADNKLVYGQYSLVDLPSCSNATTSKLLWNTTTHLFSCGTDQDTGGSGVSDGDKGDITASSSGTVWTIDNGVVSEAKQVLADNTTQNVTSSAHGYAPKAPADATKFLNGANPPAYAAVKDSDLSTSDITTNDVSTSKHGFAPKGDGSTTKFLNANGVYSTPAGGGAPEWQFSIADEILDEAQDTLGSGNFSVGTRFKVTRSGVVLTGIRFRWAGGVGALTVDVKLFTTGSKSNDSTFSTTVDTVAGIAVNAAGFYTGTFSSPQALVKNQWYAVTAYETAGGFFPNTIAASSIPGVPTPPFFDGIGILWRGRALKAGSHTGPDTFDATSWHAVEPVADLTQ